MKRRAFITLLGGAAAAWPLAVRAQQAGPIRVGYLGLASAAVQAERLGALRAGLRDLGYIEGKSIIIEYRWAEERYGRLDELAAELVHANVDMIVTHATPGVLAAKHATSTIPIIMAAVGDAVSSGLVASIARPGRFRLATSLVATGSLLTANTTGIVEVAALAAYVALRALLTMTGTCRPTNSAASDDNRSLRPSVQAYSMVRF